MDAETVRAAQQGDADALGAIVDDLTPTVLGAAYGLCGSWDLAGDIAQETFATLIVRLGDVREPAALPGWLMAVVRTSARRARPKPARLAPMVHHEPIDELVVARDEARRLRAAVEALEPSLRLPMVLHYFAGLALADIADLCELPVSTVKKRMRVARARLREEMDMTDACAPAPATDPTDVIRMYTAMRSGDVARVAAILDVRPDLVDVRESWTRTDSFAHRLPVTQGGGTPLLRAVERGDLAMVRLLLDRGADVNGACSCAGGESPLWVAVVQRETEIVDELLGRGADPNVSAFDDRTALEVARLRGYGDIAAALVAAGARDVAVAAVREPSPDAGDRPAATGIKAIDLWCPLPARGVARVTPGFGLGVMVLLAELSLRAARAGQRVVWTGFVQAPTDLGDVHHGLAETGIQDAVVVSLASPAAPHEEQLAAMDRGIALAGDDALLVLFAETGRETAIDERLPALAARGALTLVVAPLDGSAEPPAPKGSPYLASITFDIERARAGRWPAISSASWSKVADDDIAALADRARQSSSDALDDYLCQPFYVAEPFLAPGVHVPVRDLRAEVERVLRQQAS